MIRTRFALLAAALLPFADAAAAQPMSRPHLSWRTVETQHFRVHYPVELGEWTLGVAAQLDAVHAEVSALIGYAPGRPIDVVVEDPYNVSNGFAIAERRAPTIVLWPTPPEPGAGIGHLRDWGELLAVHEYAHIAHLLRPPRNPRQRLLGIVSPVSVGPVARRAPRWVTEGYATYVEGRLTGSGRPYSVGRPAVLRQWALEGRLPTYAQLNGSTAYQGMGMAYLVGSAFLEWLVEQRGEESLVHLWRRLSARQNRSFDEAFAGVFGGLPADLYGRFTVELTARALTARDLIERAGLEQGDTVQALSWTTGSPAVSPDGEHLAIVLRSRTRPARIVVWPTADEPADTLLEQRRALLLERDPEDVPAIEWRPRARRPLAVLAPVAGRAHDQPRFLPDGERLLVTRFEPIGDGSLRPDLFVWHWRSGRLQRVTRGAGVRSADPLPDGRGAIGVRCLSGRCDLVHVDLATGELRVLQRGTPARAWYRPRVSPDGSAVVAAVQERGRWRLVRVDLRTGEVADVGPADGASRYDAEWLPGGERLVTVSERGGVANLEIVEPATGAAARLTQVTGAVLAPAPNPADGGVFFLNLHSRGFDLQHVHPDSVALEGEAALPPELFPVAPPEPAPGAVFEPAPLPAPRAYGSGPRSYRVLPAGGEGADGAHTTWALASSDPVGRLGWVLQGSHGSHASWRGGSLRGEWRGTRPALGGDLFVTEHHPSRRGGRAFAPAQLDADYAGGVLYAALGQDWASWHQQVRAGAALGRLANIEVDGVRLLTFSEYRVAWARGYPQRRLGLALALHGAAGRTAEAAWWRAVGRTTLRAEFGPVRPDLELTVGRMRDHHDVPLFEHFAIGGAGAPLFDEALLAQRIAMPALPFGIAGGTRVASLRAGLAVGALRPYAWAASVDDRADHWFRVAGVEHRFELPTTPLVRLPAVSILNGIAHSFDEPRRGSWQWYSTISVSP